MFLLFSYIFCNGLIINAYLTAKIINILIFPLTYTVFDNS